jgi:hypothetical protein
MRKRCLRAKHRRAAVAALREPVQITAARPITFAELGDDAVPHVRPLQSKPFLEAWPEGYAHGGFKIERDAIVLFAAGKPDIRIEDVF